MNHLRLRTPDSLSKRLPRSRSTSPLPLRRRASPPRTLILLATLAFGFWIGCAEPSSTESGDRVPPGHPADFSVEVTGPGSVRFSWTSTGDNGLEGRASGFETRISVSPLTDEGWSSSELLEAGHCLLPGCEQVEQATGIAPGSWYFGLRIVDEAGNWSPVANSEQVEVTTLAPPPPVVDLQGRPGSGKATLVWTAPTPLESAVVAYDMRYSRSPLDSESWSDATVVHGLPTPAAPGEQEGIEVTGLGYRATYYFALRSTAARPTWSDLSNVAEVQTGYLVETLFEGPYQSSVSDLEWDPRGGILYYAYVENTATDTPSRLHQLFTSNREDVVLTDGDSRAYGPAVSPDGSSVAYIRERTENVGGEQVTFQEIAIMDARPGATPRTVTLPYEHVPLEVEWSPDGLELAYTTYTRMVWSEVGVLWIVPRYSGEPREVFRQPFVEIESPSWSPEGSEIAFLSYGRLCVVSASGGDASEVVEFDSGYGTPWPTDLQWTGGGQHLSVRLGREFVTVNRNGEEIRRLRHPGRNSCGCTLSPNGRELAFTKCGGTLFLMGPIEMPTQAPAD